MESQKLEAVRILVLAVVEGMKRDNETTQKAERQAARLLLRLLLDRPATTQEVEDVLGLALDYRERNHEHE